MLRTYVNMPGLVFVFLQPRMSLTIYLDVPNETICAFSMTYADPVLSPPRAVVPRTRVGPPDR